MMKKILGIDDKSIVKKSTYYGYLLGAIFGFLGIISGIFLFIFKYSNTYQIIYTHQNNDIKYLESLSKETQNINLLNIAEQYKLDIDLINDMFINFSGLIFILGFTLITNFILFKQLKNKVENEATQKALKELGNRQGDTFSSVDELFHDLDNK